MRNALRAVGLFLRINQIGYGAATLSLGVMIVAALFLILKSMTLIIYHGDTIPWPLPNQDQLPLVALFIANTITHRALHFWICTLGIRIINKIKLGEIGAPEGLTLLRRLRVTLLLAFVPSVVSTFLLTADRWEPLSSGKAPITNAYLQLLNKIPNALSDLLFVRFDGFNTILAALLVGAIEYYLRENRSFKEELDHVI